MFGGDIYIHIYISLFNRVSFSRGRQAREGHIFSLLSLHTRSELYLRISHDWNMRGVFGKASGFFWEFIRKSLHLFHTRVRWSAGLVLGSRTSKSEFG